MKNFKKSLSSVLAVLLVFCMFASILPQPAYAAEGTQPQQTVATDVTATDETTKPETETTEGETQPPETETKATDPTTESTEAKPAETDPTTGSTETKPTETDPTTESTETKPAETDPTTESTETKPAETDPTAASTETAPEETTTGTEPDETVPEETEESTEPTEEEPVEEEQTAILVSPEDVAFDGTKSYILFTANPEGDHYFGIGPEADPVEIPEIPEITPESFDAKSEILLPRNDLGWTLRKAEDGSLFIQNADSGLYLTVSEDQLSLTTSEAEAASGLVILEDGMLSLASVATASVYLKPADPEQGPLFQITNEENETVFYFAEIQPEDSEEEPTEPVYTEPTDVPTISLLAEGQQTTTAIITAPDQLKRDGKASYVIFTPCLWGGHTYAIGPDGTATPHLGLNVASCVAGGVLDPAYFELGWTLTDTENGLVIANNSGYLTLSEDRTCLTVSKEETVSGLTIDSTGKLILTQYGTESVYLHMKGNDEPHAGQAFGVTNKGISTVFYFAELQEPEEPEPPVPTEILFPALLPQANFRAEIVSPDQVYGDDQYVIFTANGENYTAITSDATCSAALSLDADPDIGVKLFSPDSNVLWTVNNNRDAASPVGGFYKFIRSCATNGYLTANSALLGEEANSDFYLAKEGNAARIATKDGKCVVLDGDTFTLTTDWGSASLFYFAKLLQPEQQSAGSTADIPDGYLLELVNWSDIQEGGTYAILNATEFNYMHYALSGNGRLARYGADNLTQNSLCPNTNLSGVYGASPCAAAVGDIFYTNGKDILWTVSGAGAGQATFQNDNTKLYLKISDGVAAEQTPSVSGEPAAITIEPAGDASAYLSDGAGRYLGIWQYISVAAGGGAERCAYYLAKVIPNDPSKLPETKLEPDEDASTFSFGGLYSIYQGSQHLLTDSTGVENFILMDDGEGSFKPSGSTFNTNGENNFTVTYCADFDAEMPIFTNPGKYKAMSLDEYEGFDDAQKAALTAIVPNCYPYVSEEQFLANLKAAGAEVSGNCGTDEILAGIQAAIYTITNPRSDGNLWGYESSDGWAHNSYEVNKASSYVSDPVQAGNDVNTVRDYLLSLASPAAVLADDRYTEVTDGEYFAIYTEIDGELWALTNERYYSEYDYGYYDVIYLAPYDPDDIQQLWYKDEHGSLQWFPGTIYKDSQNKDLQFFLRIDASKTGGSEQNEFSTSENGNYYGYPYNERETLHHYGPRGTNSTLIKGYVPVKLTDDGHIAINDYDHKFTGLPEDTSLSILYDEPDYHYDYDFVTSTRYWYRELYGISVFDKPAAAPNEAIFKTEKVTPRYPNFVEYDLETDDWTVEQRENTYDVTISGKLNFPPRDKYDDIIAVLYINGSEVGTIEPKQVGAQAFTVSKAGIPDSEEVHFTVVIKERYVGLNVFVPDDHGWQIQIGGVYNTAYRELHESTLSIPVQKVWADDETVDHSGDEVEVRLKENGVALNRDTVKLNEGNDWKGKFKHVPYEHWTYNPIFYVERDYGSAEQYAALEKLFRIPLRTHQYSVEEVHVPDGYTVSYDVTGGAKPGETQKPVELNPGTSYPVQAVYKNAKGEDLLLSLTTMPGNSEPYPTLSEKIVLTDSSVDEIFEEWLKEDPKNAELIEKNPEMEEEIKAEIRMDLEESKLMAQGQKFFLNGKEMLVSKTDFVFDEKIPMGDGVDPITVSMDYTAANALRFEKAENPGEYYLSYFGDYLKVAENTDGSAWVTTANGKEDATPFALQNLTDGSVLETIPTDSYEPQLAALQVYEDGKPMTQVLTLQMSQNTNGIGYGFTQLGFEKHPETQLFMIVCCDGEFIAVSEAEPMVSIPLESAGNGEYLAKALRINYPTEPPKPGDTIELQVSRYICKDPTTSQVVYSKNAKNAMHFGMKIIPIEDILNGKLEGGHDPATGTDFTVINSPEPTEPDPTEPDPTEPEPTASLEVRKTVSGKKGDQKKKFTFTVTLNDKTINGDYGDMTFKNGKATFQLKHGEKMTAKDLPAGTKYKVVESGSTGYTVKVKVNGKTVKGSTASGRLDENEKEKVTFNNDKPEKPKKPSTPRKHGWLPHTGDTSNIELWLGVTGVTLVALIVVLILLKKKKRK